MTPQQFKKYQEAFHLSDIQLGFILGLRIEESKTAIPAFEGGELDIGEWVQPELMKWLTLYREEFQRIIAFHQEGEPYVSLPINAIKDRRFYQNIVFYRPDLQPEMEIGEWPAQLEIEQIQEHLTALKGAITLIEFESENIAATCLGEERFSLFEHWYEGYNNFVRYAAGELRQQKTPYLRIEYSCREHTASTLSVLNQKMIDFAEENDGAVLPLFPVRIAETSSAECGIKDSDKSWQEFIAQKKLEATEVAPAFEGLL